MSTVAATNLKNASSSVNNAVTTSGGDLTNAAGVSFMGGSKNLLYNGAMQVAQRGTSATNLSTDGYFTADRWNCDFSSLGTWTQTVENDAPTGSGLRKSLKMLCTTADASPAAGDYFILQQVLEGQDLQRVAKGTASAQQLTLSFWVKSNVTGTYIAELQDADNSRRVSGSYSVSASATWEKKTITFPADMTGAFDNDNAASLYINFWLGSGSTYSSSPLQTSWGTSTTTIATGQTNLAAATNNYWQVTGTQLEIGPVATSFEFKSYGQELRECQRYYYMHANGNNQSIGPAYNYSGTQMHSDIKLPVTMRIAPDVSASTGTDYFGFSRNGAADTFNSLVFNIGTNNNVNVYNASQISGTAGQAGFIYTNSASAYLAFTAEL